jgi:hypothetical protein
MLMRRVLGGDRFWWLSMGLLGVVGTLVIFLSLMGWFGSSFAWGGVIFSGILDLTRGVGSKISFWEDVWCGESSLKDTFLSLFSIARFREVFVADNFGAL